MYTITEPAPAAWESFVLRHPRGHLLQRPAWGQLKATFGWRVQRVAVATTTDADAHLLAGAQVLLRSRYGVGVAYVPRGPLLAEESAANDMLLDALAQLARRSRAVFLRLEPECLEDAPDADHSHTWLLLKGFQPEAPIQPRSTIHVALAPPPAQIFASFSKGHRADIRRAERQGVQVRVGGADDIGAFFAIMQDTGRRAEFGIHAEAYYYLAWKLFQQRNGVLRPPPHDNAPHADSRLLLAEQEGRTIAAHMVFADARTGFYLYSGAAAQGMKAGANHLLQWHALQWARERGCTSYDLWGIPDALGRAASTTDAAEQAALEEQAHDDPLIGVYRFKKGFGGHVVRYLPAYDQVYLAPLYRLWKRRLR
jgi:lipid II:glycine glycyltransferase (peptidoglycan interpeptide bridge formation enzyme)